MFKQKMTVKMHHTDAAGIIFYARIYEMAQDAIEEYLNAHGLGINLQLTKKNYITPIVHSEANYYKPMRVGDEISILISVEKCGKTSFTTNYDFLNKKEIMVAQVKTVNVCMRKLTGKKMNIPKPLRVELEKHLVG